MVRHTVNLAYRSLDKRLLPDERHQHVLIEEDIELTGTQIRKLYPGVLCSVAI